MQFPREFTMIGESMSDLAFCAGLRFRRCPEGQFFAGGKANDRVSTWLAFSSFLGDTLCREIKMEPSQKSDCSAGIFWSLEWWLRLFLVLWQDCDLIHEVLRHNLWSVADSVLDFWEGISRISTFFYEAHWWMTNIHSCRHGSRHSKFGSHRFFKEIVTHISTYTPPTN